MIEVVLKYWKVGLVLAAIIGGLIGQYALPSIGILFSFLLDVRQVQGSINDHEIRLKKAEEVIIRSDERYKNMESSAIRSEGMYKNIEIMVKEINERERQDRLTQK